MDTLLTLENGLLMTGENPSGARIAVGRPDDYPGATSPMELVLHAVAGCSSIDILMILEKQKATVTRYRVQVHGLRPEDGPVKPFTAIELHYDMDTDAPVEKVLRAVSLSVEKYCSVAEMLKSSVDIRYKVTVNGQEAEAQAN